MADNVNRIRTELEGKDRSLGRTFKKAGADASTFSGKLKLIAKAFKQLIHGDMAGMKKSLGTLAAGFGGFAGIATAGIAAVIAAAAGLVVVLLKAKRTYEDWMQKLDDFQDVTDMSAESVSLLAFHFRLADVDVNAAGKAIKKFTMNLGSARLGNATAIKTFDSLGVALTNLDGSARSVEEVLMDARDRLHEIKDPAKRAAMANKVFGKSWADLADWIAKSSAKIKEYTRWANELGMVMGEKSMQAFQDYRENQRKLSVGWDAIKINAFASLVPMINDLMPKVIGLIWRAADWVARFRKLVEKRGWESAIREMVPWVDKIIVKIQAAKAWWDKNRGSIVNTAKALGNLAVDFASFAAWMATTGSSIAESIRTAFAPLTWVLNMTERIWAVLARALGKSTAVASTTARDVPAKRATPSKGIPKALGGPVSRGMTYLVGERGPELFHAPTSGTITPNSRIGSAAASVFNLYGDITFPGVDPEDFLAWLESKGVRAARAT